MQFNFDWIDRTDKQDYVLSNDVNSLASGIKELQAAANDIDADIKDLRSAENQLQLQDGELQQAIADEAAARETADNALQSQIGTLSDLTTQDSTSLTAAVNEVNDDTTGLRKDVFGYKPSIFVDGSANVRVGVVSVTTPTSGIFNFNGFIARSDLKNIIKISGEPVGVSTSLRDQIEYTVNGLELEDCQMYVVINLDTLEIEEASVVLNAVGLDDTDKILEDGRLKLWIAEVVPPYNDNMVTNGYCDVSVYGGSRQLDGIDEIIGDLSDLQTTDKSSIVGAINELASGSSGGGSMPDTYPASKIVEDSTHRFVSDAEKTVWNSTANKLPYKQSKVCLTVGTTAGGHTADDCDYLCDGTDDQVQINAAIQALPATGGEVVILCGNYNLTAKVAIEDRMFVTLRGQGRSTILRRSWNSTENEGVINVLTPYNIIEGFCIDGNNTTYIGSWNYGIYLNSTVFNKVKNNLFSRNTEAIRGVQSTYNAITKNQFTSNANGIVLFGATNNTDGHNVIRENIFTSNDLCAMTARYSDYNFIIENTFNNNVDTDILIRNSSGNSVTDNICRNGDVAIEIVRSNRNNIIGNICIRGNGTTADYTDSQYTIYLSSGESNQIADNIIMGKDYVNGGGDSNTFVNNKFE